MVSTLESDRKQAAKDLGLTETELAFYNILMAEVMQLGDGDVLDEAVHEEIKATTRALVEMFDEATQIVDFFKKDEEIKRMKKAIKRAILDCSFADKALVGVVQDRFMELAKSKFT